MKVPARRQSTAQPPVRLPTKALCSTELPAEEATECFKYLAFGYVAVGENDLAKKAFADLLSVDEQFSFDEAKTAPKIREQFELSRVALVEGRFSNGKALYSNEDYSGAADAMRQVLKLEPDFKYFT